MKRALAVAALVAVLVPSVATGQPGRQGGPPLTARQVEQMWDTYVTAQARTALGLNDEAQFLRFGAALRTLQGVRRRLQQRRNVLQREMTQLVAGDGAIDQAAVEAKLAEYDDLAIRSAQQVRRAYAEVDAVLTLRQRVRFRVFERRMAERKLELLAQARANTRGRRHP